MVAVPIVAGAQGAEDVTQDPALKKTVAPADEDAKPADEKPIPADEEPAPADEEPTFHMNIQDLSGLISALHGEVDGSYGGNGYGWIKGRVVNAHKPTEFIAGATVNVFNAGDDSFV